MTPIELLIVLALLVVIIGVPTIIVLQAKIHRQQDRRANTHDHP